MRRGRKYGRRTVKKKVRTNLPGWNFLRWGPGSSAPAERRAGQGFPKGRGLQGGMPLAAGTPPFGSVLTDGGGGVLMDRSDHGGCAL